MAILAECPICHKKQSNKNKFCKCGEDLDRAKRSQRVKYWLHYQAGGKQIRKSLAQLGLNPYSIEDARDAEAKRRVDRRERRKIFNERPETKLTFAELAEWYLDLESVKILASYDIIKMKLDIFNKVFGERIISDIKPEDISDFQLNRRGQGIAPATVDQDIGKVKAMIRKAFDNDIISAETLGVFMKVKKTLKKGSDVRDRILSPEEFEALLKHAEGHTKGIIAMGYYTGMRKGEILSLTWDKVNLKSRLIELEPQDTKDREARDIPICDELYKMLYAMPNRIQASGKDNHVFQYKGKPITHNFARSLRRACEAAGIKYGRFVKGGFIFHDLRHTFNTNMRKAGIAEGVIMKITGHSTREMFDRYDTIDEDDTKKAVKQFEGFLQPLTKPLTKPGEKDQKDRKKSLQTPTDS
jgi:integrase